MNKYLVAFLILACAPAFAGDAPAAAPGEAAAAAAQAKPASDKKSAVTDRKVTKGEIGKKAVCPVTKEEFKVTAETPSVSYKGKVYYFCCGDCPPAFRADPEKYAAKAPAAGKAAAKKQEKKAVYVCPMGDYRGDKPGKCPKCGMPLVKKD